MLNHVPIFQIIYKGKELSALNFNELKQAESDVFDRVLHLEDDLEKETSNVQKSILNNCLQWERHLLEAIREQQNNYGFETESFYYPS